MPLSAEVITRNAPPGASIEARIADAVAGRGAGDVALAAPVWLCWRRNGRPLAGSWHDRGTLGAALARSRAGLAADGSEALEICLTRDWRRIAPEALGRAFPNTARGLAGIEIRLGADLVRVAPSRAISGNRAPLREVEQQAERHGMTPEAFIRKAEISRFEADQFLVLPGDGGCIRLWRGGQVVAPDGVGPAMLEETVAGLSDWLRNNLHADGRMTYKYWPSRGQESQADNTIRQFMATVALGRNAARSGDPADAERARRNLARNLATYYAEPEPGLGTILLDGKAKLGAMALAALAVLEFRGAGLIAGAAHAREFEALCRGIDHLWQPDGAFRTFLLPADRNDNQNFYPGEAMLFWAALHRETRDAELAQRFMASFRWYRAWHLAQPNPAFVPWHSQACVMMHEDTGAPELSEFVFDRNDWLLALQQWDVPGLAPDFGGRFYDPARPEYGPPHASATGVYMESLAAAWRLALRLGEDARAARYALALRRGLRAVRQLQFRDRAVDGFYISRPAAVMGGLRTETYNNEIRVDNVQHCLMALLTLVAEPGFPWGGGT